MNSNKMRLVGGAVFAAITFTSALPAQTPATAPAAALPQAGYILGPDDEVAISVYGRTDMAVKTRIAADGTVNMPLLGPVRAAGMTAADLSRSLAAEYSRRGYLTKPSISVEVSNYVSRSATVLGNVPNAGNYPLDRPYTIAMLIARAGGVRADGANVVVLTPMNGAPERLSLADMTAGGARLVRPGDTLFVPPAEMVYVYGQVNEPGAFAVQPGMTYRQALARAGGPTLAGSTRRIEVRRGGKKVDRLGLDDVVQPEDVLIIKEKLF